MCGLAVGRHGRQWAPPFRPAFLEGFQRLKEATPYAGECWNQPRDRSSRLLGGGLTHPDLAIHLGRADQGAVQLDIDADDLNDTDADGEWRLGAILVITGNDPDSICLLRTMVSWGEL